MRYAIVSDIHANIRAWNAVLADIRSQGEVTVICLGDVVGYGPKPAEVLAAVREETSHFVMGNHDAAAVGMMDYSIFNDHAREAIEWTMGELDEEAKEFLGSVPLAIEAGEILFVHAEVQEPGRFDYIDGVEMAEQNFGAGEHFVSFVGHTHMPKIFEREEGGKVSELPDETGSLDPDKRYIVNVGSVGEPRNPDDLSARYVVYDSETRVVDFRRVTFDIEAYRKDLESTSLSLRPYFLRVFEEVIEGHEVVLASEESHVDMQVVHGSAALIDLGRVSETAYIAQPGSMLASAQPSRGPIYALVGIGVVTVMAFFIWAMTRGGDEPEEIAKIKVVEEVKQVERKEPVKVEEVNRVAPVEAPQAAVPSEEKMEKPKKVKKPVVAKAAKPKVKAPDPKPVVEKPVERILWGMDESVEGQSLKNSLGKIQLLPEQNGRVIKAIAPNPVPLNQKENPAALQVGIWKEEKPSGAFVLSKAHSFTFEGWFILSKLTGSSFLVGTRSGEGEVNQGWHVDLRPPKGRAKEQQMAFFYDSGDLKRQALAEAVVVADRAPHHFAVVWNHDASSESGEMLLYLDGAKVATKVLRHSDILGEQVNPLRVGFKGNRNKVGLDELKFTRSALEPHEFLLKTPILGAEMVKSNPRSRDSWGVAGNWKSGEVPQGKINIIIQEGVKAQAERSPKGYSGSLVLKKKSSLVLREDKSLTALPKAPNQLVMFEGSSLTIRTGDAMVGPIELKGDASISGGNSTDGRGKTRTFSGEISGKGMLTLDGVGGNKLRLEKANTFTGGLRAFSSRGQAYTLFAAANRALGTGDVTIGKGCGLAITAGTGNTIADDATLSLEGAGVMKVGPSDNFRLCKVVIHSTETVGRFIIDGKDQGEGEFSKETHPILGGGKKLRVVHPKE